MPEADTHEDLLVEHAERFARGAQSALAWVDRPKLGGLSVADKALLRVVTSAALDDVDGARAALRPAAAAGVTVDELVEGLLQLALVAGLASWRRVGAPLLHDYLRLEVAAPSGIEPDHADFRLVVVAPDGQGGTGLAVDTRPLPSDWPAVSGPKYLLWGTDEEPTLPLASPRPDFDGIFPPPHGVRVLRAVFRPGHGVSAGESAGETTSAPVPEIANAAVAFQPDGVFGMHATETVDFGTILRGSLTLVHDDDEVALGAGDSFILTGNNHRWKNYGPSVCELVSVMVGTERSASTAPAERNSHA